MRYMANVLAAFIFLFSSNFSIVLALNFFQTCTNQSNANNYVTGGAYSVNLDSVLSSMLANIDSSSGFSNASVGEAPNRVYGMVLCRGDIEFDVCWKLVQQATDLLPKLCPNNMEAVLWHDNCTLRYSNEEIVGKVDTSSYARERNFARPPNPDQFNAVVMSLLDDLRMKAANTTSPKKIAVGSKADLMSQTVYALVQCTPDLHPEDCNICLTGTTDQLQQYCNGMTNCSVFRPNCNLRYGVSLFFNESNLESLAVPPPPAPVPLPAPGPALVPLSVPPSPSVPKSVPPTGNHVINKTRVVLPVIVSIAACLTILVFISILLWRRRRKYKRIGQPESKDVKEIEQNPSRSFGKLEKINRATSPEAPLNPIKQLETSEEVSTVESQQNPSKPTDGQLETIDEINSVHFLQTPSRPVPLFEKEITTECQQYEFSILKAATNGFAVENRLGQGAFGTVYKGVLQRNEIAVKKLSENSTQGEKEFKAEVLCLSQVRHKNLVSLRGYSIEGTEKLLVYELVPNGSLNRHIFDVKNSLDWRGQYKIILGIAKGLVYLNEECPETIIHCDLKASNVLLDKGMNAKISDFGLARLFGPDWTHKSTMNNNVGTRGYMPPEYTMQGRITCKFDVYSFGVLLLEIISARKWNCMTSGQNPMDLISYTMKNWRDGTKANIVDTFLWSSSSVSMKDDILKCIRLGILCVEENPNDRPTMSKVVSMLNDLNTVPSADPAESTYNRWLDPPNSTKGNIPSQSD